MTVPRSSAMVCNSRIGSNWRDGPRTSLPPRSSSGIARSISGPAWKSGPNTTVVSRSLKPKSMIFALDDARVVAWVKMMPLGRPVVPDECNSIWTLPGRVTTSGSVVLWPASHAS